MSEPLTRKTQITYEDYAAAMDEIERLREAQRWIPVSERLPEDFDDVLVIVGTKYRHIMYRQSGCWWKHGWPQDGADVTHWMPLPQPPQEAEG